MPVKRGAFGSGFMPVQACFGVRSRQMKAGGIRHFQKQDPDSTVRYSIRNKILALAAGAMLPFLALAVGLLVSMKNYSRTYGNTVSNMTIANNYNLNFKEEMDESLYKLDRKSTRLNSSHR